jgi:hypothetical protein
MGLKPSAFFSAWALSVPFGSTVTYSSGKTCWAGARMAIGRHGSRSPTRWRESGTNLARRGHSPSVRVARSKLVPSEPSKV